MDLINVNGVKLEVQRIAPAGGGKPLAPIVFLHEGLGSLAMWQGHTGSWPEQVCNATGRTGVVYSRHGYGQSDPVSDVRGTGRLPPDYMHSQAFDVLPALLQAMGVNKPVLLGHSDGATIALLHASRFDVEACIVMAPHVMVEDVSITAIEQAKAAFETGELRQRLARYHADVDCAFWQWNDAWLSAAFRSFDIRPDCRRIRAPVLAMQGVDDPYGTMAQIEQIAPTKGSVQLEKLFACGHSPQRDQPAVSLKLVSDFLRGLA